MPPQPRSLRHADRLRHLTVSLIPLLALLFTSAQAGEFDTRVQLQQSRTNSFYITGRVEGLDEQRFLVDTGASYVTLTREELETLQGKGLAEYQRDITGRMADGSRKVVPIYRIARINLGGRCDLEDIEVAVLPGKTRRLLGLSALRKAGPFIFSMDPPEMILSGCSTTTAS